MIFKNCIISTIAATFVLLLNIGYAGERKDNVVYWPLKPIKAYNVKLSEPIYKTPKKIWYDLPYTDVQIKSMALKGLLWTLRFMNSGHLQGNESNYLTMLSTIYRSAKDPYFRRIAWEEARNVFSYIISSKGFYEDNDVDSLLDYLSLFNHLGLTNLRLSTGLITWGSALQ